MKNRIWLYSLILMSFVLILLNSCKKDEKKEDPPSTPITVTDIDGNIYHTVTIGTQVWLVENLKTTKYRNGIQIPEVTEDNTWGSLTTGAYCNYDNNAANSLIYGRLYNWYTISDSQNAAPIGWHVSTDADWATLISYLGGDSIAGGKLKETGTNHWQSPNVGATNMSGFTALPGGYRYNFGQFADAGSIGRWLWALPGIHTNAFNIVIDRSSRGVVGDSIDKRYGFSVRCVED